MAFNVPVAVLARLGRVSGRDPITKGGLALAESQTINGILAVNFPAPVESRWTMRKAIFATIFFALTTASVLPAQQDGAVQHSLRIFVAPLESNDQPLADMVTAKLISHLVKHGLSVVDTEENADVVLTGAGMVQSSLSEYGHTHYKVHGGWRLVSKKDDAVIWADDVSSSRFATSASSSFADNVAKSVEEALGSKSHKE